MKKFSGLLIVLFMTILVIPVTAKANDDILSELVKRGTRLLWCLHSKSNGRF